MTTTKRFDANNLAMVFGLGLAMPACTITETQPACTWLHSPDECNDGDDEVGIEDDPVGPCITAPNGTSRTLHQCHGEVTARISFTALGMTCPEALGSSSACQELHEFGTEPYPLTQVMACCDPYADDSDLDEYLGSCAADLAQQICTSMSLRIEHLIADGMLPKTAETTAIQKWIANHQNDCFQSFWSGIDGGTPGDLTGSWSVPNKPAWQALIKDFTLTIDSATIVAVGLPDDADNYLACTDNGRNDTEIFESMVPASPGIIHEITLASAGAASLAGPIVMGGYVSGAESLTSNANDCGAPWCSNARLTVDGPSGTWQLEDMNLFVDGRIVLANGSAMLPIERASVRLHQTSSGTFATDIHGSVYMIPARAAYFVVSGASDVGVGLQLLSNASPITAHESGSGWVFDGFVLDDVDAKGDTWTLTLPPMNWST